MNKDVNLEYSFVLLMMWRASGLIPCGNLSSAELNGMHSPVSRFNTLTFSNISYKHL